MENMITSYRLAFSSNTSAWHEKQREADCVGSRGQTRLVEEANQRPCWPQGWMASPTSWTRGSRLASISRPSPRATPYPLTLAKDWHRALVLQEPIIAMECRSTSLILFNWEKGPGATFGGLYLRVRKQFSVSIVIAPPPSIK